MFHRAVSLWYSPIYYEDNMLYFIFGLGITALVIKLLLLILVGIWNITILIPIIMVIGCWALIRSKQE